jgi:hypothetical protein
MNNLDKAGLYSEVSNEIFLIAQNKHKKGEIEKAKIYEMISELVWSKSINNVAKANQNGEFQKQDKAV